jgi:dihydroorotate dehydrogenase (fumarate)
VNRCGKRKGEIMADLKTKYMGLELRNPLIVGSSGLTNTVEKNVGLAEKGAGGIVLKSIFEEEIALEYNEVLQQLKEQGRSLSGYDYYDYEIRAENLERYTKLIRETKANVEIPVIASVNCVYSHEWSMFAKQIEKAGADALELNLFVLPSDLKRSSQDLEHHYFKVIDKVLAQVSLPVAVKMSYYFSSLGQMIKKLSETKVAGLVLFNRFYSPDFDLDTLEPLASNVLSSPDELPISLRWVALMSGRVDCDLAASTGVHDGNALIKQLLAGARAVQVASTLYKNGIDQIGVMLKRLESWMKEKGFETIDDFCGKLSQETSRDPAIYERVQFMKYFGK